MFFRVAIIRLNKRKPAFRCMLLAALCLFSNMLYSNDATTLYFYSPEVNTSRNTILKGTFDKYFAAHGGYHFQPVEKQEIFEELLLSSHAKAVVMSFSHYVSLVKDNPFLSSSLIPTLQGEKDGNDSYFKILVSSKKVAAFSGELIASSRGAMLTLDTVSRMFSDKSHFNSASLKTLEVPKDIDALMAVGFGLADLALTTDDSLSTLSSLYHGQYQDLHVIGKSDPQKRLILVLSNPLGTNEIAFTDAILSMPKTSRGKRAMKLLGLDSWRRLLIKKTAQGGRE